ncbi:MAG TPA: MBL fold metallo-hydrolase [Geobacterales bacterium]|nr:MBL fold metallo-hydrolase [Geobacterales bacterium]
MRLSLLASGSKGNAIYVESGETRLLIDAGLTAVELSRRLDQIGVPAASLHAILVTHEHQDHVGGAGTLARRLKIPVVMSYPTHRVTASTLRKVSVVEFETGYPFCFRDLLIDPFSITHDAVDPVAFVLESREGRLGVATDLGVVTGLVREKLKGCRLLVMESNHDEEMLANGPYPWHLKQRIRSRHGHLSNTDSAALVQELLHPQLAGIFLAHLSEVNNDPELARRVTSEVIESCSSSAPALFVGNQYAPSELFEQ